MRSQSFRPFLAVSSNLSRKVISRRWPSAQTTVTRFLSNIPPTPTDPTGNSSDPVLQTSEPLDHGPQADSISTEDPERLSGKLRRSKVSSSSTTSKDQEIPELTDALDILWLPKESLLNSEETSSSVPPPEIFDQVLDNLLITLHPQNQHKSLFPPKSSSKPLEPTLGLYCPLEGGDYVIDATVQELAFRTGAEVLVLDSVQLAAGEHGRFGQAANALNLPDNPLHIVPPQLLPGSSLTGNRMEEEEEEEEEDLPSEPSFFFAAPSRMSALKPPSLIPRSLIAPSPRRPASPSKLESFFAALVNMPLSEEVEGPSPKKRPRLIYIRDFTTLAPSSSVWYPPLLAAVRQRRRGHLQQLVGGVSAPVTIIFGMTPGLILDNTTSASVRGFISTIMQRAHGRSTKDLSANFDWSESEAAELAREHRLRQRLKRWEESDAAFQNDFPELCEAEEGVKPDIMVLGDSSGSLPQRVRLPMALRQQLMNEEPSASQSQFFRSSVLLPRLQSKSKEKECRVARRREINELTICMALGAIGGRIEAASADCLSTTDVGRPAEDTKTESGSPSMWEAWGNTIETWPNVCKIADRALGRIMEKQPTVIPQEKNALDHTLLSWPEVQSAWNDIYFLRNTREIWLKEATAREGGLPTAEGPPAAPDLGIPDANRNLEKVIEDVKKDPKLESHEQKLLSCIVNPSTIGTTFGQVHLPPHTIDSVRTIVSLPLIHPLAFKQGILKDHSMIGCLLFGPPGTGKTLVVRALAKEAGCNMLAVSPSDIMDMYVGEGEKLVRAVFSLARRLSPCVVFLDEIDALFGARITNESGSTAAHRRVITEFMQEMDGLKSSKDDNIVVIGATNRPFDLDDAVLRRLPRRLLVDLPREIDRHEILKILLRDEGLAPDVDIKSLAKRTEGYSGSDLKHLCVSAALDSVKENLHLPWSSGRTGLPAANPDVTAIPTVAGTPGTNATQLLSTVKASNSGVKPVLGEIKVFNTASDSPVPVSTDTSTDGSQAEATLVATQLGDVLTAESPTHPPRVLHLRNFTQALQEITPSSSESLGSLAALRKWNEEFGEGGGTRKKRRVWGNGRFGFIDHDIPVQEGRVLQSQSEPGS